MKGISAFIPVYNEEYRIEFAINSLQWCNEIVVLDKGSNDNTKEIALKRGAKVIEYREEDNTYSALEFNYMRTECQYDWIILFTASDIIHPNLAYMIKRNIQDITNEFETITVPFRNYVLGIGDKFSPWYSKNRTIVFKKNSIAINFSGVHDALVHDKNKTLFLKSESGECVYHLTHNTVDHLMDRHLRYWKGEANNNRYSLKKSFRNVMGSIKKTFFINKSFFRGKDGIALAFAYISYFMMSYVYRWAKKYNNADTVYFEIRNQIDDLWRDQLLDK